MKHYTWHVDWEDNTSKWTVLNGSGRRIHCESQGHAHYAAWYFNANEADGRFNMAEWLDNALSDYRAYQRVKNVLDNT
jgi:hypothetical protein